MRLPILIAALSALFTLPLVALAAPARTAALSGDAPVYEWTGTKATASTELTYAYAAAGPCGAAPLNYCDDTLLEIKVPAGAKGTALTVEIPATGANDFDIYVYRSNSSGAVQPNSGVGVSNGEAPSAEKVTIADPTGFYLVRVVYYEVKDAAYPAKATLSGLPAPAAPAPTQEPPPPTNPGGGDPQPQQDPAPKPPASSQPPPPAQQPPFQAQSEEPQQGELRASLRVIRTKLATARRRGLRMRATCSRDCRGRVAVGIDRATARRLRLGRKATVIGRASFTLTRRGTRTVRVRMTRKAARALNRTRSVKLTAVATVTDPKKSQRRTVRRSVRLKR